MREFLNKIIEKRAAKQAELDAIVTAAEAREDTNLTEDESSSFAEIRAEIKRLDEQAAEVRESLDAEERAGKAALAAGTATAGIVSVKSEPVTYDKRNAQRSYFHDVMTSTLSGNAEAAQRLQRHAAEVKEHAEAVEARADAPEGVGFERRDLSRTDGSGGYAVPPLWMMNEFVALARAARVTADLCSHMALPSGTDSINVPKVSTGTSTAAQTADNAAVSETDLADTSIAVPVRTIAGQQDLAMQLLEQSPIAFDQIVFGDLAADYATRVDAQVLSGTGSNGQVKGIFNISSVDTTTYTDSSATVPEMFPKLADSINQVATTRYMPPTAIILHPRRWYWLLSQLDSSSRPFAVPAAQGPNNALASTAEGVAQGPAGHILGVPVYVDPSVPATLTSGAGTSGTEDCAIVTRPEDHWLFEGNVRTRVLQEVLSGTLTVRLQLYNYVAFTAERYIGATSIVSGTGFSAPAF